MATSSQQFDRVDDGDCQLDQGGRPRHRVADHVGHGDVGGDRGDDAVDQGRQRQRRRSRRGGRGDLLRDQRDGGVGRGGGRDDGAPGGRGRAELQRRSSRCRARSRAWRRAASALPSRRRPPSTSAAEMERSVQAVSTLARQADEMTRRVAAKPKTAAPTIQRSIQGIARMRESMAQSALGDARDGEADRRHHDHRRHHQPDRRTHQPAVAQRVDRGGAGRRCRPRVCRRRRGDSQPGRSVGQGDGRHRRRSSRRCRTWRRMPLPRRTTACASPTRAALLAESGATGLKKILAGIAETVTVVGQIARPPRSSARPAGRRRGDCARPPIRRGLIAAATAEQATAPTSIVQATTTCGRSRRKSARRWPSRDGPRATSSRRRRAPRRLAAQVRKATSEQAASASEIVQAVESMRKGAQATTRALAAQSLGR